MLERSQSCHCIASSSRVDGKSACRSHLRVTCLKSTHLRVELSRGLVMKRKDETLEEFRAWVRSLQWTELQNAMEFSLQPSNSKTGGGIVGAPSERDLLKTMVQYQVPPATPIHGRAMGYQQASEMGANDGKNEFERVQRDRILRPRLLQWTEDASTSHGGYLHRRKRQSDRERRFHVLARKFVRPDGERLSLGCTAEQRAADEELLFGTVIVHSPNGTEICVRYVGTQEKLDPPTSNSRAVVDRVLRILKVASRGHFLSVSHSIRKGKKRSPSQIPYCAPWFDPTNTKQWFTLSMYLASRFEVALWESFQASPRRTTSLLPSVWVLAPAWKDIVDKEAGRAVLRAIKKVFLSENDVKKFVHLRDSMIWTLLENRGLNALPGSMGVFGSPNLDGLLACRLTEIDSPGDEFRSVACTEFQQIFTQRMEEELLSDVKPEKSAKVSTSKHRKRKQTRIEKATLIPDECPEDEAEELNESSEEAKKEVPVFQFPNNATCDRDRNRNIVMSLSIIEQVMDKVFQRVGLTSGQEGGQLQDQTVPEMEEKEQLFSPGSGAQDYDCASPSILPPVASSDNVKPISSSLQYDALNGRSFHGSESNGFIWDLNDARFEGADDVDGLKIREQSLLANFFGNQEKLGSYRSTEVLELMGPPKDGESSNSIAEGELYVLRTRSPSPQAPATPPPTLVSVADVRKFQGEVLDKVDHAECAMIRPSAPLSSTNAASVPNSPSSRPPRVVLNSSRDDTNSKTSGGEKSRSSQKLSPKSLSQPLRSSSVRTSRSTDDHDHYGKMTSRKSMDALSTYRNALLKRPMSKDDHDIKSTKASAQYMESKTLYSYRNVLLKRPESKDDHDIKFARSSARLMDSATIRSPATKFASRLAFQSIGVTGQLARLSAPIVVPNDIRQSERAKKEVYASSDVAFDELNNWHDSRRTHTVDDADNNTTSKDGSTTITSALSHRDSEELTTLRDERNSYRDMCLTLGAEVAKLKNMLAAHVGTASASIHNYSQPESQVSTRPAFFDPEAVSNPFLHGSKARTLAAMSDAGYRGEHESLASDDDTNTRMLNGEAPWFISSVATLGSDVSAEHAGFRNTIQLPGYIPMNKEGNDQVPFHGMHSRLASDIFRFVESVQMQLRKQDSKRRLAVERMTKLVNTVWPRAQVKLYGSHVTGLCLPSSDVDFVICLPAVHKKAIAVAPGALEGRNAINESSQKLLARKLKGESWIDPRSMKLIERTVVPVIKVTTKDAKARTIQLDITFDGPSHHGIAAVQFVTQTLEELPMIQPLVLVLKQFLLERGLLTAYTGGLSSYCLFLMVTRYLQEQPSAWGDCGSLLMGFLDFYGNHVSDMIICSVFPSFPTFNLHSIRSV